MKSLFLAVALIGASAAAAQHNPTPSGEESAHNQTQTQRENAKSDGKAERICRNVRDSDSGSMIRGRARRCLTAEQWRALNRED